jgi:hypothetical protein
MSEAYRDQAGNETRFGGHARLRQQLTAEQGANRTLPACASWLRRVRAAASSVRGPTTVLLGLARLAATGPNCRISWRVAQNAGLRSGLGEKELAQRCKFFDSALTLPQIGGENAKYAALVERLMLVTYWNRVGQRAKQ